MRRLSLLTAVFALFLFVAQLGLWVGEVAQRNGPQIAFHPVEARAPVRAAPAEQPPRPGRTFAHVLPYAPPVTLAEPGAFQLVDTEGRIADRRDLAGRHSLVFFGYTHCGTFCAATLDALSFALVQLGIAADDVSVLFITVDPARDTSAALADYVSPLHENVRALTGTDEQIDAALAAHNVCTRPRTPAWCCCSTARAGSWAPSPRRCRDGRSRRSCAGPGRAITASAARSPRCRRRRSRPSPPGVRCALRYPRSRWCAAGSRSAARA